MKILKKAEQKNFIVNKDFYTRWELEEMLNRGTIVNLFDDYRIYACDCKEVKVICNEGFYTTVVITNSGEQIFVQI